MKSIDEYTISKYFEGYFLPEVGNGSDYKFRKYYKNSRQTSEVFLKGFKYLQYQDLLSWSYKIGKCTSHLCWDI